MDNFKIIYKILKALELALDDEQFDVAEISHEALNISQQRWINLMLMLLEDEYITGVQVVHNIGRQTPKLKLNQVRITIKGLEYLEENSFMAKAAKLAKGIIDIVK